jgi:hypothetical protein
VQERQPRRTELFIAGRLGIENAPRGIEVGLGVAVVEQPPVRVEEPDGGGAPQREPQRQPEPRAGFGGFGRGLNFSGLEAPAETL